MSKKQKIKNNITMKINKNLKVFALIAITFTSLTFSACKRKDAEDDSNQKVAVDNAQAELTINSALDISEQALDMPTVQARTASESHEKTPISFPQGGTCATIDVTTPAGQANVRNVVIDFGSVGCAGADGRVRRGKVLVTFTRPQTGAVNFNPFNQTNTTTSITFDNHFVDDVKVEGTKTVTVNEFVGATPNNNFAFLRRVNIVVVNGKLSFPDGTTHTWNTNRNRRLSAIHNPNTPLVWRSTVRLNIWGTYAGVNRNGVSYSGTCNENESLLFKNSCPPNVRRAVSGILTLTRSGRPNAVLNFGDESCDNTFTVTVNGNVYTVN